MALVPLLANAQTPGPAERELALGKQLAAELERNTTVIGDAAITGYVDRIARTLAAGVQLPTPLIVKVISAPNSYVIALPGGFLEISTRLIVDAENEAELAGAIAHQIGHLVEGPATPPPATLNSVPLLFMGWGGLCVRVPPPAPGAGVAMPMGYLAASRENEAKADALGLGYMQAAGYDPGALADFYERIKWPRSAGSTTVSPSTRTAADSMRNARPFLVSSSEFAAIQRKLTPSPLPAHAQPPATVPSLERDRR